jgi:putative MATE family efflux protein
MAAVSNLTPNAPATPGLDLRTRRLLEAPIVPLLFRLAWPNVLVMLAQSATGLIETFWVGKLGVDALAGMALVFPGVMLMQMISAGAMGGGISAAVARALGARRPDQANALVVHALFINGGLGLAFSVFMLLFGSPLYRLLGGSGASLYAALIYSNIVFAGNVLLWIMNALASVLRGTGNILVPGLVIMVGAVLLVPLSPLLIFGYGWIPALGIAGGATALVLYYLGGTLVLVWYIANNKSVIRFQKSRLRARLFVDILKVGAVGSISSLQTNVTVGVTTGLIGAAYGTNAVAGYGTGARLEYLLIPVVFGIGAPMVAIVGTCIGAGDRARALRVAVTGSVVAFAITEVIGIACAIWPAAWLDLFGHDAGMQAMGIAYLRMVGPFYGFFGLGLALYFASQGAGRLFWPLAAGTVRVAVALSGAWLSLSLGASPNWIFLSLGAALLIYGLINATAIWSGGWFTREQALVAPPGARENRTQ